jgi:hypothetical protein
VQHIVLSPHKDKTRAGRPNAANVVPAASAAEPCRKKSRREVNTRFMIKVVMLSKEAKILAAEYVRDTTICAPFLHSFWCLPQRGLLRGSWSHPWSVTNAGTRHNPYTFSEMPVNEI